MPTYYCYWRGNVPAITELFFASFLATQRGELHVFLDRCDDIGPLGLDYLQTSRVIVRAMDWKRFNPDPVFDGFVANLGASRLDARLFRVHQLLYPHAFERHPQQGMKFTSQRVTLPLWGRVKQPYPMYLYGDLFRCMLCARELGDVLYADLDVCFLKDFTPLFESGDFLYRWERQPYANNAILYSAAGGVLARVIKDLVRQHATVAPWYLFLLDEPRLAGARILPCEWFDPLWATDTGLTFDDFFNGTDLGQALDNAYCHHWHNHWHIVPQEHSAFTALLHTFRRMLGATR
jgi:hypothetical protein